ncbi:MAG TPA: AAA family ATPase [Stellaceae bacterium]|nr:AAA family ATPase [Stellaceae bacterium]
MLGWLKRKTAPVSGEPSRKDDEGHPPGDERLERLLGRLGSDSALAGEHAAVVLESRPRPAGAAELHAVPLAAERSAAEDPAETVLNEIYPPAAVPDRAAADPEEAVLNEIYPPPATDTTAAEPEKQAAGETARHDADPAAAEPSAAEAPAVAAIPQPIAKAEPPQPIEVAAAGAAPPAEEAAAETASVATGKPVTVSLAALRPMTEEDAEPDEESEPRPRRKAKSAPRRAAKKTAEAAPAAGGDDKPPAEPGGGFPPMFVIAVASQKGGAGKTTLAAHLAVRAGIAGQGPVVLIDTDPQGSLAEWWHARQDDTPALAVVKPEQLGANLAELRSYGTAVAIIDTPPALTGSIEQVIAMADLIVIPVRPSPHDLRAAGGTVAMAQRAGKPFLFVVNGASPRAGITAQAVAALSEHGRVAPVILYQRTEFAASMIDGRTVVEAAASGRSAQEIAELWQCVYAQIGMRAAA